MSDWEQIGTVEIMRSRVYPMDPKATNDDRTYVFVEPGVYPVYRKVDLVRWVMTGRINERMEKIGDGLYAMHNGESPTGPAVQFSSPVFWPTEFADLLGDPACQDGPEQRLRFNLEVSA